MRPTTFEEFAALARDGTFVPVWKEVMADLLTPVSAFLKVAEHSDFAFLLESVEGGERLARYSFLGKDPFLVIRDGGGVTHEERHGERTTTSRPLLAVLRDRLAEFHAPRVPGLPRFTGGAVGIIGQGGTSVSEGWPAPRLLSTFMLFDTILAFDHVHHRLLLVANARITPGEDLRSLYQFACARIQFMESELDRGLSTTRPHDGPDAIPAPEPPSPEAIDAARAAVLSSRFEAMSVTPPPLGAALGDPFSAYRALRHTCPSPYMYFLRIGCDSVAGASSEMLVRIEGTDVETQPVAGICGRGSSDEDDGRLAEMLRRDEGTWAAHVRLVQSARADLRRACAPSSVRVAEFMSTVRTSHSLRLGSRLQGEIREGADRIDAMEACLPPATTAGTPKSAILPDAGVAQPGSVHGGAVAYLDFAGSLDSCVANPTFVFRDGRGELRATVTVDPQRSNGMVVDAWRRETQPFVDALTLAAAGEP